MRFLSRSEEWILIAIWKLKTNAYAVTIEEELRRMTGESWAIGALFVTLDRMSSKGYLDSQLSAPTPARGGRRKRLYRLTTRAVEALNEIRQLETSVWRNIPSISEEDPA